jgi:hypothetical protein
MDCFAPIRFYLDGNLFMMDSIRLTGGDSIVLSFLADGRTWRLEADQHPLHPGNSHPNAQIEACGNLQNWTPDLFNLYSSDDADPITDYFCGIVLSSLNPNDKTGYPYGLDSAHYILQNTDIEYLIRFQNTGNDTAFTVIIRDTLAEELDIFSVRSGASSHNYSFRMYGPRVLEWRFNNIMLPDSNINFLKSQGFVKFNVKQQMDLTAGTIINNSASIYFDQNPTVITNTYFHTVDTVSNYYSMPVQDSIQLQICENEPINGYYYAQSGTYFQPVNDSILTLFLTVLDNPDSSLQQSGDTLIASATGTTYQWVNCNNAFAPVNGATGQSFVPTVNGNYAVEITANGCTVQSACQNVVLSNLTNYADSWEMNLFPNPTENAATVQLDLPFAADVRIRLVDNLGRILQHFEYETVQNIRQQLRLDELPAAIYSVEIIANGVLRTKTLIILRK